MKNLQSTLCCIAFAIIGVCIASVGNKDRPYGTNTATASVLPYIPHNAVLPTDLQLGRSLESKKDTVIIRDTVRVTNKPKKVRVPYPVVKHDTLHHVVLLVAIPKVREEKTLEVNDSVYGVHAKDTLP